MEKIVAIIIISAVLLVLLNVSLRTKVEKNSDGDFILKYPAPIKLFGLILLVLGVFLTITVINTAVQKDEEDIFLLVTTCFSILFAFPLFLFIEILFGKCIVNEIRIFSHTPWSKKREIRWEDVTEVRYSRGFRWFVIRNGKTKPVRVSSMVAGINELVLILEQKLPSDMYEKLLMDMK